jgi:uncharacterized protein YndB with AHSA1/START domain
MKKLEFHIAINAPAAKIWKVLWNDYTYRQWTRVFHEGSYAVTDWKEGGAVQFLTPEGNGMYARINVCQPEKYMEFKHLGHIKNFVQEPVTTQDNSWGDALETYLLREENGITGLTATADAVDNFEAYFQTTFPKAIELVKQISEQPVFITVGATLNVPVAAAWKFFTEPEHIMHWNQASADWHTTKAVNDLKPGGSFNYRMEAKEGGMGFDFTGIYSMVELYQKIAYTMPDGRTVAIDFAPVTNGTAITQTFMAEDENSYDLQYTGWQAICDYFKTYTENHS